MSPAKNLSWLYWFRLYIILLFFFFFQAEDGIRDHCVTGVQTCALPISCVLWGLRGKRRHIRTNLRGCQREAPQPIEARAWPARPPAEQNARVAPTRPDPDRKSVV